MLINKQYFSTYLTKKCVSLMPGKHVSKTILFIQNGSLFTLVFASLPFSISLSLVVVSLHGLDVLSEPAVDEYDWCTLVAGIGYCIFEHVCMPNKMGAYP